MSRDCVNTLLVHGQAVVAEFEEEDPLESLMKHVKEKEAKEGQAGDGEGELEGEDELEYTWPTFTATMAGNHKGM